MALTAVRPAMNNCDEQKSLHPFFSKPDHQTTDPATQALPTDDPNDDPDYEQPPADGTQEKPKRKRTRKSDGPKEKKSGKAVASNQALLLNFTRPTQPQDCAVDAAIADNIQKTVDGESNEERRKRRKTNSPPPTDSALQATPDTPESLTRDPGSEMNIGHADADVGTMTDDTNGTEASARPNTPPRSIIAETAIDQQARPQPVDGVLTTVTPKKQMKVTKSGKLFSSPPKSIIDPAPEETSKRRRGRKPTKPKTLPTVTVIKYGTDTESRLSLGAKIEAILNGPKSTSKKHTATKVAASKPTQPPKSTHPFFLGKPGPKPDEPTLKADSQKGPPTPKKTAVTPGKLRAEAIRDRLPMARPEFGMSASHNRVSKQSGLFEASWPTKETAHVRNLNSDQIHETAQTPGQTLLRPRKSKHRAIALCEEEEIISRLARDLDLHHETREQHESEFAPPEHVRLPKRLLTTGVEIQQEVRQRLKARLFLRDEQPQSSSNVHPAVKELFDDIEHTLTPFDQGRCEAQAWVQKYNPKSSSHVLQDGQEASILKDWLKNLTVMAVGGAQGSLQPHSLDARKPPKKKRKRAEDAFIVSDDEEDEDELISCTNLENPGSMSMRISKWSRNKNVILISGPHGCGKSATVHAVAKELDFEVFEINSGTRRSGKDIQERVGDMTANHLVNHKRHETKENTPTEDTDTERLSTALQNDLDSGRQGTMMNFFKSGLAAKPKAKPTVKPDAPKPPSSAAQAVLPIMTAQAKSQKQSLILFEEADILFEEDQQFWATVTKLAAQSKRPIVITCYEEQQIPVQDLPLAAKLRLRIAPIDLATDYLLVLAGREGHILEREAVSDLYMAKGCDLRASINELNFWCQMSVGDKKGGLEWMYQRWPLGKDADAQGRLLRVASEQTYQSGMGFLSHNIFESNSSSSFDKEEELLTELWQEWGLRPDKWMKSSPPSQSFVNSNLEALNTLDTVANMLSATDVFCQVGLPTYDRDCDQLTDPTLPSITQKSRLSYTLAAPLLQIDHCTDFLSLDQSIYTQSHLVVERLTRTLSGAASCPDPQPMPETDYAKAIIAKRTEQFSNQGLSRFDFSIAFDILAAQDDYGSERTSYTLTPSSFDRNFRVITQDLAPYVRSIVAHEQVLEEQRLRLSNLLSEGGKGKRPRTTRASRVALEGGVRETKRRDRWFDPELDFGAVMATAGKGWTGLGWKGEEQEAEGTESMTQDSVAGSQDVAMQEVQVMLPAHADGT